MRVYVYLSGKNGYYAFKTKIKKNWDQINLKNIAIFVDVQNIYYTVKQIYSCHFNYSAFWKEISSQNHITKAYAYAVDRNDAKQKQFQNILSDIGFTVKLKPFLQRSDGSAKGDWDVGITIDVLEIAPSVDGVILASGDGDFAILLQKIMDKYHVFTEVYGVPELTSELLIQSASRYHPIGPSLLLHPKS